MVKKIRHLIIMEKHTDAEWRGVVPATHGSRHTRYVRMSLENKRSHDTAASPSCYFLHFSTRVQVLHVVFVCQGCG